MLSMREAASLLSSSRTIGGIVDVLGAAGFQGHAVELDPRERDDLGLEDHAAATMLAGPGSMRALILPVASGAIRDDVQRLARRLSARAPHVLWVLGAVEEPAGLAVITAWSASSPRAPRLSSFVWEPGAVVDSDAETLCALAALPADADVALHGRWMEVLGRDALTRRFYRALEAQVASLAGSMDAAESDARDASLIYVTRLLFLHFLQAKGWLDGDRDFIATRFDRCMATGGRFQERVLLPLFFGTLNTPVSRRAPAARALGRVPFLNGGLFARTAVERRLGRHRFPDECFGALLDELFTRFRFVAREDTATWSEASVDPEMLGRAFESLMASSERRAGGVYYTPHALVAKVAEPAIVDAIRRGPRALREIRVLDPACGSGAFLVYALERIATARREAGDRATVAEIRRDVLARSIFGVDRSPTAVWLCELRLWLAVVIEADERDPRDVPPLPNLDRNIRVGDALTGPGFAQHGAMQAGSARLAELRRRYVRSTGRRKEVLGRTLDREERRRVLAQMDRGIDALRHARRESLAAARGRDLFGERAPSTADMRRARTRIKAQLRALRAERRDVADGGALPFAFSAFFSDAQTRGGFDVVIGNPPWVRVHRIPAALRLRFKEAYDVYRSAYWEAGTTASRAGKGFASQVDLASIFVERGVRLLRDGGVVSLLLPSKLWRSLAGGGVRRLLTTRARLLRLEDFSESARAFDAVAYPSLLVARAGDATAGDVVCALHGKTWTREWRAPVASLTFDRTDGAPWLLLPRDARKAFDRIRDVGPALSRSHFGPPRLGVKSGCNTAFLVRVQDAGHELASVRDANGDEGTIELAMLRPALRGDGVAAWQRGPASEQIVWTHDDRGAPLAKLPDRAKRWLARHYEQLAARSDAARSKRWWSLFRVDAADSSRSRVVWADIGKSPRALVLGARDNTVPLNSCYVIPCADETDAWSLAAILNSGLAAAWINAIAEPARGGYRRYLGWTVGLLPLPRDWRRARAILGVPRDTTTDGAELLADVMAAYGVDARDVDALMTFAPCD